MKCSEVQDLILTDYLDGEMTVERKEELERHLAACRQCREFELTARRTAVELFEAAEKVNPPEAIWRNIKERIQRERYEARRNPIADFLYRLKSFLVLPRPVLAAATVIAAILIAVVIVRAPMQNRIALNDYLDDQMTFLTSLETGVNGAYDEDYAYFDTSIEEYLFE